MFRCSAAEISDVSFLQYFSVLLETKDLLLKSCVSTVRRSYGLTEPAHSLTDIRDLLAGLMVLMLPTQIGGTSCF